MSRRVALPPNYSQGGPTKQRYMTPPPWGGRHIVQGLGVCSYLRAVGFDPHTFSLTDGMRPLRCGGIASLPSTFRLAIISRLHGGMEANAGGNGGSHVPADPRVPFATLMRWKTTRDSGSDHQPTAHSKK